MPAIFLCSGIIFILELFNSNKQLFDKKLMLFCLLFCVGFFIGNISVTDINFNIFHLVSFFIFLSFFINSLSISGFLISIIFVLAYYLILDLNEEMFYSFYKLVFILLSIIPSFVIKNSVSKFCQFLISSLGMLVVNVNFDIQLFTFSTIDFLFLYNLGFVYLFVLFLNYNLKGIRYAKKDYFSVINYIGVFDGSNRGRCFCN